MRCLSHTKGKPCFISGYSHNTGHFLRVGCGAVCREDALQSVAAYQISVLDTPGCVRVGPGLLVCVRHSCLRVKQSPIHMGTSHESCM